MIVTDLVRGCGYRKKGGLYLMADGEFLSCGKLPIPLDKCPCCGAGIKFSRGFQWVGIDLINTKKCRKKGCKIPCKPFDGSVEKVGLLWIGKSFYPQVSDFTNEALRFGVSRRIKSVPKGFVIGETYVALAHLKAITDFDKLKQTAGIFSIIKPDRIEYVIRGDETSECLDKLVKRGITPVEVQIKSYEQTRLA